MIAFLAIIRREVRLAFRQGSGAFGAVLFFVLTAILFAFGVGPEPAVLARMAPAILWVAALLASQLALDRLFEADFEDGTLELQALGSLPLVMIALAKAVAHWLVTGLPLVVAAPLVALMLQLEGSVLPALLAALLLGTPTLSLLGAVGAALVLGARRAGLVTALIVLPLEIPVLIAGVAALDAALGGLAVRPYLLLLGGALMLALPLCPLAAAAALRQALR